LELKSKRVLRHPCWCLTSTRGCAYGPARTILPQRALLGLRKSRRGTYRDPQPKRVPLSLQKMRPNLLRHQGHSSLPGAQATRVSRNHRDAFGIRLPATGHRRGLLSLDERTVSRWQRQSGRQCRRVHEHVIQAGGVLLGHVQADELRIRIGKAAWCVVGIGAFG
jgi:hypothetical protein